MLDLGTGPQYLAMSYMNGPEMAYRTSFGEFRPPVEVLHPLRRWAWPALAAGFLPYVLIPWPLRRQHLIAASLAGVIVEDMLTCALAFVTIAWTVVVAIPFLAEASEPELTDSFLFFGITGIGAALCLALLVDAVRRVGFGVLVAVDGIMSCSITSIVACDYEGISGMRERTFGPPRWLGLTFLIAGLVIWPLLPFGILLLLARSEGIELRVRDIEFIRVGKPRRNLEKFDYLKQCVRPTTGRQPIEFPDHFSGQRRPRPRPRLRHHRW